MSLFLAQNKRVRQFFSRISEKSPSRKMHDPATTVRSHKAKKYIKKNMLRNKNET